MLNPDRALLVAVPLLVHSLQALSFRALHRTRLGHLPRQGSDLRSKRPEHALAVDQGDVRLIHTIRADNEGCGGISMKRVFSLGMACVATVVVAAQAQTACR